MNPSWTPLFVAINTWWRRWGAWWPWRGDRTGVRLAGRGVGWSMSPGWSRMGSGSACMERMATSRSCP